MTGSQSKKASLVEALTNTVIGFGINYTANLFILPLFFGTSISLAANFWMGCIYTVISVMRSYVLRRWFNMAAFNQKVEQWLTRLKSVVTYSA